MSAPGRCGFILMRAYLMLPAMSPGSMLSALEVVRAVRTAARRLVARSPVAREFLRLGFVGALCWFVCPVPLEFASPDRLECGAPLLSPCGQSGVARRTRYFLFHFWDFVETVYGSCGPSGVCSPNEKHKSDLRLDPPVCLWGMQVAIIHSRAQSRWHGATFVCKRPLSVSCHLVWANLVHFRLNLGDVGRTRPDFGQNSARSRANVCDAGRLQHRGDFGRNWTTSGQVLTRVG